MQWLKQYHESFKGLSRETWYLAWITLINRAGTMVVPFLALYLKHDKGFTLQDVGWVMSAFGLGSVSGAWIGGILTGKMGYHRVMYWSLLLSGVLFILLSYLDSIIAISSGIFILMLVADSFRPAAMIAITEYAGPDNRMRSISLYRLAINLGFSFGPAVGGALIASLGYSSLFWVDGLTCVIAGLLLIQLLGTKETKHHPEKRKEQPPPYSDKTYLLLIGVVFLTGFTFLQYFSTVPLYYKEVGKLSEDQIGWLMTLNGALIFVIEMPLVKKLDTQRKALYKIIVFSFVLMMFSFISLIVSTHWMMLTLGMLFVTIGEILNFPFLNNLAIKYAENKGSLGAYMALYTMAFSVAHIVAHNAGLWLIAVGGYQITWLIMALVLLMALILLLRLQNKIEQGIAKADEMNTFKAGE